MGNFIFLILVIFPSFCLAQVVICERYKTTTVAFSTNQKAYDNWVPAKIFIPIEDFKNTTSGKSLRAYVKDTAVNCIFNSNSKQGITRERKMTLLGDGRLIYNGPWGSLAWYRCNKNTSEVKVDIEAINHVKSPHNN